MHYAFDLWIGREFPHLPWCRYADDGLIHCNTWEQAEEVKRRLEARLKECGLEIHPEKTKVIYCADKNRKMSYPNRKFTFLSYDFCARPVLNPEGKVFVSFSAAVSKEAKKRMRRCIKYQLKVGKRAYLSISQIAEWINPIVRGWFQYYGKFQRTALKSIARYIEATLARWARRKYIKIPGLTAAYKLLSRIRQSRPSLFTHWGMIRAC